MGSLFAYELNFILDNGLFGNAPICISLFYLEIHSFHQATDAKHVF
jgi:hypothetical protein